MTIAISTDISDPAQVQRDFQQIHEKFGPIDLLINHADNAAWKEFADLTPEDFEQAWRVCVYVWQIFMRARGCARHDEPPPRDDSVQRSDVIHSWSERWTRLR